MKMAAVLSVLAASTLLHAEQRFTSTLEVVRVDVLVMAKGRPVAGLTAADFDVRDNGVRQSVNLVGFESMPLNVVLALDASASVAGDRMVQLRAAAGSAVDALRPGDEAALVTFNHIVSRQAPLSANVNAVRAALANLQPSGTTAMIDGAYAAMLVAQGDADRALVIVFSDGVDTASFTPADAVLDVAKRSDAVVYGVYTGGSGNPAFLRNLTALTGGDVLQAHASSGLRPAFIRILDEFRQRYVLTYSPRDVPATGWHTLTVKVTRPRATVKARPGYMRGK